jgi:hypothetical protein
VPGADVLTSEEAANTYENAVQAWGREGWARVARICRWAKGSGLEISCPPPSR